MQQNDAICCENRHKTLQIGRFLVHPYNPPFLRRMFRAAQSARSFRFGRFLVYRLHGHPVGQCVGDRVHDFLCRIFAAVLKDVGGEVEADVDGSSEFGHVTLPLSSDFRRRPTQLTTPDGWYCRLQVYSNGKSIKTQVTILT